MTCSLPRSAPPWASTRCSSITCGCPPTGPSATSSTRPRRPNDTRARWQVIEALMAQIPAALPNVYVSLDTFGWTAWKEGDNDLGIGQRLNEMAKYVDYISPMVYPSTFEASALDYAQPAAHPYEVVYRSSRERRQAPCQRCPARSGRGSRISTTTCSATPTTRRRWPRRSRAPRMPRCPVGCSGTRRGCIPRGRGRGREGRNGQAGNPKASHVIRSSGCLMVANEAMWRRERKRTLSNRRDIADQYELAVRLWQPTQRIHPPHRGYQ